MKSVGISAAILVVAAIGSWSYVHFTAPKPPVHAAIATPPPGARPADPAFLADFDQFVALSADVAKRQDALRKTSAWITFQQEQDEARGIVTRLNAAVPQGFSFDEKSRSMVPAMSVPTTRTLPPAPPQPPKK